MTYRTLFIIVAGAALGLVGCGYSCEDFCQGEADCSDSNSRADCETSCADLEQRNEAYGCDDEYDRLLECVSALQNLCDDETAEKECGDEEAAWQKCGTNYCLKHSSTDDCDGFMTQPR